jgi:hypothetical protein
MDTRIFLGDVLRGYTIQVARYSTVREGWSWLGHSAACRDWCGWRWWCSWPGSQQRRSRGAGRQHTNQHDSSHSYSSWFRARCL